jgi:ketosteroid isomerase-like protein
MTNDKQHDVTTEFNEALAAGFAARNFEGLGAFYTEDTRLMPPRGRALEGRGSIGAFWLGVANRFSAATFTTVDLKTLGETVRRETGTYTMGQSAGQDAEGQPGVQGRYVFVWLLVEGEWQIESSIWNRSDGGGARQQGQGRGQGGGQGQRTGQGRGGAQGGQGGGYRQGRRPGQGGGNRQGGQGGGYRQGGQRPSFQGGAGGVGQRRGGRGPGAGGQGGGGAGTNLYDGDAGLYSNPQD